MMLESYINKNNVLVPIKRIEESKYLFGTKKIAAKIINGRLMVRVGGGYMTIEEFVEKHQIKEIDKLKLQMTKQNVPLKKIIVSLLNKYKEKKQFQHHC